MSNKEIKIPESLEERKMLYDYLTDIVAELRESILTII